MKEDCTKDLTPELRCKAKLEVRHPAQTKYFGDSADVRCGKRRGHDDLHVGENDVWFTDYSGEQDKVTVWVDWENV